MQQCFNGNLVQGEMDINFWRSESGSLAKAKDNTSPEKGKKEKQ